jgi:NAD(P)-dependent dehydrogenase (short-subunit alcohol dehydrogenase family)
MNELAGKVAHVTAGGAGIGRGIARRLAAAGATVVVSDEDEDWGPETASLIEAAGGRSTFVRADATSDEDLRSALVFTDEEYGRLDVLVNNAGGAPSPYFPDAEPAHWLRSVVFNLHSAMIGTYHAVQAMRDRGGCVLQVSSMAGIGFGPHASPEYAACKAALWRLTAALAPLADEAGIRVNCICPDWVETERMREQRVSVGEQEWAKRAPPRLVSVDEIAAAALRLIGDEGLAGRVLLCPWDGDWGLASLDDRVELEPLPGFRR